MTTIRFFLLVTLSITLVSCGFFTKDAQLNDASTIHPFAFSPTPKPLVKITSTPTILTPPIIVPSQTISNNPVCIASNNVDSPNGWDCLNKSYGFTVHFPSTSKISRTTNELVDVVLTNSPANSRIDRLIEIFSGEQAKSCFSSDATKIQIGEHNFMVNNGFEPSGVVYAWKSYAITKESKSVCFFFVVGYMTWNQDDPLFPAEKDQGLDDVEAILKTFRWINP